jgi:hypothetical protein
MFRRVTWQGRLLNILQPCGSIPYWDGILELALQQSNSVGESVPYVCAYKLLWCTFDSVSFRYAGAGTGCVSAFEG